MSPEQQREIYLKRILPALLIMVVYFVFISGIVSEKSSAAEKEYIGMVSKGLSKAVLPGLNNEKLQLTKEIGKLKEKDQEIQNNFTQDSVFSSHDSANETLDQISVLMEKHSLRILEEKSAENMQEEQLTKSLRDTRHWLRNVLSVEKSSAMIIEIRFLGNYRNTFNAMLALSKTNYRLLPVSLTMRENDSIDAAESDQLEWLLKIWV